MKKTLPLIRLELFHELGKSLAIDRDIFLDDNLDDDRTLTSYVPAGDAQQNINRFPYKLSFTAAVVMVRGQLTASVNGRQYQVSTGDALIVQSGSVVESMMCSSDLKIIAMAFTDGHDVEYMQRSTSEVSSLIQHRAFPVTVHLEEEAMSNYIRLYRAVKGYTGSLSSGSEGTWSGASCRYPPPPSPARSRPPPAKAQAASSASASSSRQRPCSTPRTSPSVRSATPCIFPTNPSSAAGSRSPPVLLPLPSAAAWLRVR